MTTIVLYVYNTLENAQVTSDYTRNIMELPAQNRIINPILDIPQGKP